jgi:hypothetical protein
MLPLYAARIEKSRAGYLVKVDCAACHHIALLTPEFLLRFGLSPRTSCAGPSAARQVNLNKRTQPREPERAYLAIRHAPAG